MLAAEPCDVSRTGQVVAEVAAVLVLARIIEPIYGSMEFAKLVLLVDTCTSLATFVSAYLYYILSTAKTGAVL
jgi:hypothetical protein